MVELHPFRQHAPEERQDTCVLVATGRLFGADHVLQRGNGETRRLDLNSYRRLDQIRVATGPSGFEGDVEQPVLGDEVPDTGVLQDRASWLNSSPQG